MYLKTFNYYVAFNASFQFHLGRHPKCPAHLRVSPRDSNKKLCTNNHNSKLRSIVVVSILVHDKPRRVGNKFCRTSRDLQDIIGCIFLLIKTSLKTFCQTTHTYLMTTFKSRKRILIFFTIYVMLYVITSFLHI